MKRSTDTRIRREVVRQMLNGDIPLSAILLGIAAALSWGLAT